MSPAAISPSPSSPSSPSLKPQLIDPRHRFDNIKLELPAGKFPLLQRDFAEGSRPDCGEKSYVGHGRLEGRRALITGGDSGIGRAVAIAMAREGAKVAINYLPEEEPDAEDVVHLLRKENIKLVRLPGDLLDEDFCARLVEHAVEALGGLDILVSNAGFPGSAPELDISDYSTSTWDTTFRTNVYAGFFLTRAAVKHMAPGSNLIFTVSDAVYHAAGTLQDYSASKGALNTLVKTLGISLAGKGIRVTGVAPGFTYTPFLAESGVTTEQLLQVSQTLPLKRPAQPVELAATYVDMADQTRSYTSGAIWLVDGTTQAYLFG